MPITLKKLSEIVGCDISTTSRVLNNKPNRVSEKTKEKIFEAARKTGYTFNQNARSLASGKTGQVGILIREANNSVFAEYIESIDKRLYEEDYSLLPFISYEDPEREIKCLEALQRKQIDAMICLYYHEENESFYKQLKAMGCNIIFRSIDMERNIDFDSVSVDILPGYYTLTKHLFAQGKRNIAILGGYIATDIVNGKKTKASNVLGKAYSEQGLELSGEHAISCKNSQKEAYEKLSKTLKERTRPLDALIVQSPDKLLGAFKALSEFNLKVPDDIELCVISNSELCEMLPVPVLSWAQPTEKIAAELAELTLRRLKEPDAPLRHVDIKSKLIGQNL